MKKTALLMLYIAFAAVSVAQSGNVVNDKNAQVRNVGSFHGIKISNGIDLYITQGATEGVAISASETRYRDNIKAEVENGILKIYYDAGMGIHINWGSGDKKMKAYITIKDITELTASGGSDVFVQGNLQAPNLSLHLTGGSDFQGQVNIGTFTVRQSGGSDVKISGRAANIAIDASGGSDFIGFDLVTDNCNIDATSGSDMSVTVNKELNVRASGGSDVSYKGAGVIKDYHASGSSEITRRG